MLLHGLQLEGAKDLSLKACTSNENVLLFVYGLLAVRDRPRPGNGAQQLRQSARQNTRDCVGGETRVELLFQMSKNDNGGARSGGLCQRLSEMVPRTEIRCQDAVCVSQMGSKYHC
jgi:hypothetical protein